MVLSGLVKARQLRWLDHQLRCPKSDLVPQFCLWEPSQGKRRPGGKQTTYRENIVGVFSQEYPPTEAGDSTGSSNNNNKNFISARYNLYIVLKQNFHKLEIGEHTPLKK